MKPVAPIYDKRRGQILALTPDKLKLAPSDDLPHVWAAFTDLSLSDSVASLLASRRHLEPLLGRGGLRAPRNGPDRVAVRTYDGKRGAHVAEAELRSGSHALSKSFIAGHELIAYPRAASDAMAKVRAARPPS